MYSHSIFRRASLAITVTLCPLSLTYADELLPPPIPVLRIGAPNSEFEPITARRADSAPEVITEKYPNRKVKIERQVVQDAERNYVNHGPWKMWDPEGRLMAHGEFRNGKQHGTWIRLMSMFGSVDGAFQPPYTSQAEFSNGELDGTWTISDSRQRVVGSWEFDRGELHGKVTHFYPTGQPQKEMTFKQGKLDGELNSFTPQGTVANREYFRAGKQLTPVVTWHEPNQQKQAEGWTQSEEVVVHKTIDWWQGILEITREPVVSEPIRIGTWNEWHANGTLRFTGDFRDGQPIGDHTWWHENGQKQLVGRYDDGLRADRWTRWYVNGRKQEEGEFYAGVKQGVWRVWSEEGQLIDSQELVATQDITPSSDLDEIELVPIRPASSGR